MTRRTSSPDGAFGFVTSGTGDIWSDVLLLAAGAGSVAAAAGTIVWAAGRAVSIVTGHGAGPGLPEAFRTVAGGGDLHSLWPSVQLPAVWCLAAVLSLLLVGGLIGATSWWRAVHPTREGFAHREAFESLLPGRSAIARARRLRPTSLESGGPTRPADLGVPLGRFGDGRRGPLLRASWEDVVLAICAPRSGKTTCLAVPAILDAPGPVLVTSNKADVWQATRTLRTGTDGESDRRVWVFDPQQITTPISRAEQSFAWDALSGVTSVADARRLAGHFIQEIRRSADHADFWDRDAEDLLTGLLLAAAVSGGTLAKVGAWLTSVSSVEPRNILSRTGFTQLADVMAGRSQGAHETREGVYATARAAAACLSDPAIMAWVTPRPGLDVFDSAAFARSRQTLYLLSKDGAGSAAPLIAAFADRLMLEAVRAAEHSRGGRLDPPLIAVLDEAANICRITELPRLYSHLGSRGVVPLTILQSRSQGRRVWGEAGMDELYSAATVKVIGAGIDDPAFADDLSRLLGEEDIRVTTRSSGRGGGLSVSTRRERVLAPDQIRALPKFTGLLLVTGVRPARLRLVPWMEGRHAAAIQGALERDDVA